MLVSALALAVGLTGCGGGGGGADTAGSLTLTGLAATGAGIANGAVKAHCVAGPELQGTTDPNGIFTLTLTADHTLPCMLQVSGGSSGVTLYSFAPTSGRINITPATDMLVAHALGTDPSVPFASFSQTTGDTIASHLASAKTYVDAQLTAVTGNTFSKDLLTGDFAVGDSDDELLDALGAAMEDAGVSAAQLRTEAAAQRNISSTVPAYLGAPAQLTATASSDTQITLSWAKVPGATGYRVYRAATTGTVNVNGTATGQVTTLTYTDTSLTASSTYYYKVVATNGVVSSGEPSAQASATTDSANTGGNNGGGGTSSGLSCNTSNFAPGAAVRAPTTTEMTTFARTYTGSEGDYGINPGDPFVASGSATLVLSANGSTTYNSSSLTMTSYCLETLSGNGGTQLVIHASDNGHFDLKTDGSWSGYTGAGKVVSPAAYTPPPVNTATAGVTWSQLSPATTFNACNSPYNAGVQTTNLWVAVGDSGCIRTSSDGVTWSAGSQPFTGFSLLDIVHANGRFVVVGTNGNSLTSTDGNTWTKSTQLSAATNMNAVVWTGSKFLAVGAVSSAPNFGFNVYSSTDGQTWTAGKTTTDTSVGATRLHLTGIAVNGTTVLAVGGSSTNCVAWRSTDGGSTWTFVGSNTCGDTTGSHDGGFQLGSGIGDDAAKDVAYGNGYFVAVGGLGSWAASTNGTSWTRGSIDAGAFPNIRINKVYFDGSQFIAVGNQKRIYTSTDGQTWTRRNIDSTVAVSLTKGNFYGIAGTASGRLAVMGNLSSGGSGFMTSVP